MSPSREMSDRLIVALDLPARDARSLAGELKGTVGWVKIGMTLFYEAGPSIVTEMIDGGFSVFIDLKLHDIPHQAAGAARSLARLGAGMITVHAGGGPAMVSAAVEGAREGAKEAGCPRPAVLGVTVLTSTNAQTLAATGVPGAIDAQVLRLASLATHSGADGLVCSPHEAGSVAEVVGASGLIVTPGIRPAGAALGDQARAETPAFALRAGATHLVVGRPITQSTDPVAAASAIVAEMTEATS